MFKSEEPYILIGSIVNLNLNLKGFLELVNI